MEACRALLLFLFCLREAEAMPSDVQFQLSFKHHKSQKGTELELSFDHHEGQGTELELSFDHHEGQGTELELSFDHHNTEKNASKTELEVIGGCSDSELKKLTKQKNQLQTSFDQLQTSHNNLTAEKDQLQTSFNQLHTSHNNLTTDKDQLQTSFNQLQTSHNSLTTEKDQLQTSFDHLQTSHNNLTAEKDQLQTSFNQLQLQTSHNNLTTEKDQLQTSFNQLQTSHNNLTTEKDQLQTLFNQLHTTCNNITDLKRRLCESYGMTFDGGVCYYISTENKTWDQARQDCIDRQSDLITIKSQEKQALLLRVLDPALWVSIGLTDRETDGVWKWVDGTPLTTPTFWLPGEPNGGGVEDCGLFWTQTIGLNQNAQGWNDAQCTHNHYWMCERAV